MNLYQNCNRCWNRICIAIVIQIRWNPNSNCRRFDFGTPNRISLAFWRLLANVWRKKQHQRLYLKTILKQCKTQCIGSKMMQYKDVKIQNKALSKNMKIWLGWLGWSCRASFHLEGDHQHSSYNHNCHPLSNWVRWLSFFGVLIYCVWKLKVSITKFKFKFMLEYCKI